MECENLVGWLKSALEFVEKCLNPPAPAWAFQSIEKARGLVSAEGEREKNSGEELSMTSSLFELLYLLICLKNPVEDYQEYWSISQEPPDFSGDGDLALVPSSDTGSLPVLWSGLCKTVWASPSSETFLLKASEIENPTVIRMEFDFIDGRKSVDVVQIAVGAYLEKNRFEEMRRCFERGVFFRKEGINWSLVFQELVPFLWPEVVQKHLGLSLLANRIQSSPYHQYRFFLLRELSRIFIPWVCERNTEFAVDSRKFSNQLLRHYQGSWTERLLESRWREVFQQVFIPKNTNTWREFFVFMRNARQTFLIQGKLPLPSEVTLKRKRTNGKGKKQKLEEEETVLPFAETAPFFPVPRTGSNNSGVSSSFSVATASPYHGAQQRMLAALSNKKRIRAEGEDSTSCGPNAGNNQQTVANRRTFSFELNSNPSFLDFFGEASRTLSDSGPVTFETLSNYCRDIQKGFVDVLQNEKK